MIEVEQISDNCMTEGVDQILYTVIRPGKVSIKSSVAARNVLENLHQDV